MTNKQTHAPPEEKPSVDLLRRRFKLMDEFVESIRQDNVKAGVDSKYNFIQWRGSEFIERKIVENFIAKVTDKKRPGHFWQISDLKARGLIPEEETSEYETISYPCRRLNSLYKIKLATDGRLVLMRFETWYGLDLNGQETHDSFDFLDYYSKPRIEYDRVPVNSQDPEGLTARVKIIRNPDNHENNLLKEWITPYSKEKVDEFLKYAAGPLNEPNGTSLLLKKEGVTNVVRATYDQFIAEDFDTTFDRIRTPATNFDDFYKGFKKAKEAADKANVDSYQ